MATGDYGNYNQVVDFQTRKQCSNLKPYPLQLSGTTGEFLNGYPLICGGYGRAKDESSDNYQSSCYLYNKTLQEWKLHSNMGTKRYYAASVLIGNSLWVTGGTHDSNGTNQGYL